MFSAVFGSVLTCSEVWGICEVPGISIFDSLCWSSLEGITQKWLTTCETCEVLAGECLMFNYCITNSITVVRNYQNKKIEKSFATNKISIQSSSSLGSLASSPRRSRSLWCVAFYLHVWPSRPSERSRSRWCVRSESLWRIHRRDVTWLQETWLFDLWPITYDFQAKFYVFFDFTTYSVFFK